MGKRIKMTNALRIIHFIVLILNPAVSLRAQALPLLIVADFHQNGISESEGKLLVDLFSYTAFETGEFLVLSRYERNKLLKGFGYSRNRLKEKESYIEAGELLRAEYLVMGRCIKTDESVEMALSLWAVKKNALLADVSGEYTSFEEAIDGARNLTGELVWSLEKRTISDNEKASSGLSETLYVSRIRQRILVVFPSGTQPEGTAGFQVLVNDACGRLLESRTVEIQFSSLAYDVASPDIEAGCELVSKRDAHTLAVLGVKRNAYSLDFYTDEKTPLFSIGCSPERDRDVEAGRIAKRLEAELPPLPMKTIAMELRNEIRIKEKLDMLLFNERYLSQQWFVNLHQSVIKPAVAGKFHPMLNILSLEGDVYWYYARLVGCGAGYAVSLGYPATIDAKLSSHPLVLQHELRIIPFSFRSAGEIGIIANIVTSLNMHNAYKIVYNSVIDKYDFQDERMLSFFKLGLNAGILFNLSASYSIFVDLLTLSFIVPLNIGNVTYDNTAVSGAVGGVGVVLRF
ncbi:MAG: hypothetical protein JW881_01775 [Spirochaetales bacterium]|nr:hypothetical protein [Spirochaetales bacterium]